MLLKNVTLQGRAVDFAVEQNTDGANVITILMGNNGSGKSSLFQTICSTFIQAPKRDGMWDHNLRDISNLDNLNHLDALTYQKSGDLHSIFHSNETFRQGYQFNNNSFIEFITSPPYDKATVIRQQNIESIDDHKDLISHFLKDSQDRGRKLKFSKNKVLSNELDLPNKVLAVTGSPFDKFPYRERVFRKEDSLAPYVYLGTKVKPEAGARYGRGYLSSKFDQLGASFIKLLLKPKQEYFDFSKMFDFLKISHSFSLKLCLNDRVSKDRVNPENILELVRSVKFFKDKNHLELKEIDGLDNQLIDALNYVAGKQINNNPNNFIDPIKILCEIDLAEEPKDKKLLSALDLLSEYDLIELDDVVFTKPEKEESFFLSQASSGELSLIFTMASIAGEIEDDSLIFIDEPELSLHPEWQLNFLSLLSDIFSNYKNCHFIIATHSPNLVSSIPDNNAYIVNLDGDKVNLMPSKMYHNRSADYQLASVFNSPGNNNEYLLSQVIEVLDGLCKSDNIDKDLQAKANWLLSFDNKLDDGDKVKSLLQILKQTMGAFYS